MMMTKNGGWVWHHQVLRVLENVAHASNQNQCREASPDTSDNDGNIGLRVLLLRIFVLLSVVCSLVLRVAFHGAFRKQSGHKEDEMIQVEDGVDDKAEE